MMAITELVSVTMTMMGFGWGIAFGLVAGYFMFIYFEPDEVPEPKVTHLNKLQTDALQNIFSEIPLWVKNPDWEKVDWLNKFTQEIWPYMNKAVCKIIREVADPYITEYKQKFILEAVDFESLTLGTLPPVFMGVKVLDTQEKELIFEVAAKFAGNPNVKVGVKAYGMKAVAQVVDTQVFAIARVTLKPFVKVFPCFSEINVSLMEKPYVDFGLKVLNSDLMAVPGLYRFVQDTIRKIVSKMFLWPNKLVVPILPNVKISNRAHGVLTVHVLSARQLRKKDVLGKSDPYVKLNLSGSEARTKHIKKNLNPEWNETFNLIVDDPENDVLDISVFDWDQVGSHDKLGVQAIPVTQLTADVSQTFTLPLLKNMSPTEPTSQKTRGEITLEVQYRPFDENDAVEDEDVELLECATASDKKMIQNELPALNNNLPSFDKVPASGNIAPSGGGLLMVIVHKAEDLEGKHHTNPYATVTLRGEKKRTNLMKRNRDPHWEQEFQYPLNDAPQKDRLLVQIKSKGRHSFLFPKEYLGRVEIDLSDVVKNRRINEKYRLVDSKNGMGTVQVELQWRSTGALSLMKSNTLTSRTQTQGGEATPHANPGGMSPSIKISSPLQPSSGKVSPSMKG